MPPARCLIDRACGGAASQVYEDIISAAAELLQSIRTPWLAPESSGLPEPTRPQGLLAALVLEDLLGS
jgi:hypothetical protein